MSYYPERIVCLTEETTELLYLLGQEHRIIGISGFTKRPKRARKEKPVVSAFVDANIQKILDLKPDLVVGFSDIQSDIAKQLIQNGVNVWINNQRTIAEIKSFIVQMGSLVGSYDASIALIEKFDLKASQIKKITDHWLKKPRIYFEEWDDPIISGIAWVSELIELAGGGDIFKNLSQNSLAKDRIISDPNTIINHQPDIILVSWCGKKLKKDKIRSREGWDKINAIKNDYLFEIKSEIILQPGPASLFDGLDILHNIFLKFKP